VAIPTSACGTRIASGWKPNTRTESACTHSAIGGLSTVITPEPSKVLNRNAFQLSLIERTAAE
jgi:hypothetical protein